MTTNFCFTTLKKSHFNFKWCEFFVKGLGHPQTTILSLFTHCFKPTWLSQATKLNSMLSFTFIVWTKVQRQHFTQFPVTQKKRFYKIFLHRFTSTVCLKYSKLICCPWCYLDSLPKNENFVVFYSPHVYPCSSEPNFRFRVASLSMQILSVCCVGNFRIFDLKKTKVWFLKQYWYLPNKKVERTSGHYK